MVTQFIAFAICLLAILISTISGQCIRTTGVEESEKKWLEGISWPPVASCDAEYPVDFSSIASVPTWSPLKGISAAYGGAFTTTSSSPLVPTGVKALAENLQMEGLLNVVGNMPFLTAVALNGPLTSSGQAIVAFGAGDGSVGINSESCGQAEGSAMLPSTIEVGATTAEIAYGAGVKPGYGLDTGIGNSAASRLGYGFGAGVEYGTGSDQVNYGKQYKINAPVPCGY